jgi:hypothetical protein
MKRIITIVLISLTALLVLTAIFSLSWRFQHDSPIMLYIVYLMDHFGFVPYRDILDMNMPGTYLAYFLIAKLSGYTDFGVRCVDLAILAAILASNWLWMKRISKRVAWAGTVMWGVFYLAFGPVMSLQREYLILLPLLAAILAFTYAPRASPLRGLAVGFFFGLAGTVKPHAVIGLPLLMFFDLVNNVQDGDNLKTRAGRFIRQIVLPVVAGFCLPFGIAAVYLWERGALRDFLDIVIHYWPLYAHQSGDHAILRGLPRFEYLVQSLRGLGGFAGFLAPGAIGSYVALYETGLEKSRKSQISVLIGLAICYGIYPVFAGQFWSYQWLLFVFFAIQVSSLCFIEQSEKVANSRRLYPVLVVLFVFFQAIPMGTYEKLLTRGALDPPKDGRVDEMVAFLGPRLQPGDMVQPLDWTSGTAHAMLILKARLATSFLCDTGLYHDVSNPYIQGLRRRFMAELRAARPRFIIEVYGEFKPWPIGVDTTREFEELQAFLHEDYTAVFEGDGYRIYELRPVGISN